MLPVVDGASGGVVVVAEVRTLQVVGWSWTWHQYCWVLLVGAVAVDMMVLHTFVLDTVGASAC